MAALLPTILSDDEDDGILTNKPDGKNKNKKSSRKERIHSDNDDVSNESSADEMDGDFEFGGMLVSRSFASGTNFAHVIRSYTNSQCCG